MKRPLSFALFGNVYQPRKSASVACLLACLEARGAEVLMDQHFHDYLSQDGSLPLNHVTTIPEGADFRADVAISMPAIVGRDGVEGTVPISLSPEEEKALQDSADTLQKIAEDVLK